MTRHYSFENQGVFFTIAMVAYLFCGFQILGHMGSTSSMFAGPEAEAGLKLWNGVIAIVAVVQGVLGGLSIADQARAREWPLVFSILNVLVGLGFIVFYLGFLIAQLIHG